MSYFYCSPISNIPPQTQPQPQSQPQPESHPFAVKMARTHSNSSTMSASSTSSSISIPSSYNRRGRTDSTSASFSSPWSSPSSSCTSQCGGVHGHSRHGSNQTSYLPTPYRSSLQHSCSSPGWAAVKDGPSSYFSDDELLPLSLDSAPVTRLQPREMTTEEQVAAVRAQVERERDEMRSEGWWPDQRQPTAMDTRSRVGRYAGDCSKPPSTSSAAGRRRTGQSSRRKAAMPMALS